jgi:hypothetical protein
MIRSLVSALIALIIIGAFAARVQADSINSTGTLTGTSTITATANPCLCVFESSFTGSGIDSVTGPFTTTNMGPLFFFSLTMFTSSGTFENVLAGGTLFGTYTGSGTVDGTVTTDSLITGGTGTFTGDTGESIITSTCTTTSPTTSSCKGKFATSITTAPEPTSLVLLLAGIGLLLVMRNCGASGLRPTS